MGSAHLHLVITQAEAAATGWLTNPTVERAGAVKLANKGGIWLLNETVILRSISKVMPSQGEVDIRSSSPTNLASVQAPSVLPGARSSSPATRELRAERWT